MTNKKNSGRGKTSRPLIAKTDMRIRPNKVRGQNFLVDKKVIEKIVQLGDLDADDVVLEIGAGLGAITKPLSELGNHITALEIEDDFVLYLKAAFINNTHVHIVHADARSYDYSCFKRAG